MERRRGRAAAPGPLSQSSVRARLGVLVDLSRGPQAHAQDQALQGMADRGDGAVEGGHVRRLAAAGDSSGGISSRNRWQAAERLARQPLWLAPIFLP